MLSGSDKQKMYSFYKELLEEHGPYSPSSLSWNNEFTQFIRFKVLCEIAKLERSSLLDVGCGLGDLYLFLSNVASDFKYSGIDIVPDFVLHAKEKFPEAEFQLKEIHEFQKDSFDYVLASGIFAFRIPDYQKKYFETIKNMFSVAKKGVGFNMLDSKVHPSDEIFVTFEPQEIKKFCEGFCKHVKLVQGYLPQDFTIFLYK